LVSDGETIIIDAGTTCLMVAKYLKSVKNITVLTNSVAVATELSNNPGVIVFLCGGMMRGETLSLVGPPAEEFFSSVHVNKLFLSTGGISPDKGVLTNPNIHEIPIKKKMIDATEEIIVVAGSYKFGQVALSPFLELKSIHKIVTDNNISEDIKAKIEQYGLQMIVSD
jgi:DeoR family fructose operon transcriptional repressor